MLLRCINIHIITQQRTRLKGTTAKSAFVSSRQKNQPLSVLRIQGFAFCHCTSYSGVLTMTDRGIGCGLYSPFSLLSAVHPLHPPVECVVVRLHFAPFSFDEYLVGIGGVLPYPVQLFRVLPRLGQVFLLRASNRSDSATMRGRIMALHLKDLRQVTSGHT